ncbi:MAG: hypothetical protein ACRDNF_26205 [Streptosporangiaceae bacterium]
MVKASVARAGGALLAGTIVLALSVMAGGTGAGASGASVVQTGGLPVGPVQISPLGHPRLCWEAWGNGSPVTLQPCDSPLQGLEWTFTDNGVLMNGNGYCLQNGGPVQPGSPAVDSLYLSFSGQCAGAASQEWPFSGATGAIENSPAHVCAYVRGGALVAGATIVGRRCGSAGSWSAWSQGVSDLTLSASHPLTGANTPATKATGGAGGTGPQQAFTAQVTVSNGAKAMTAYTASVFVRPPDGLAVTKLTGAGALAGWTCAPRALRCQGDLPGASSGAITITGTVSARTASPAGRDSPAAGHLIAAHATVAGTNQAPQATLTAAVRVRVYTIAAVATPASTGLRVGSIATFGVILAGLLLALGIVLAVIGRRRRDQNPGPALAGPSPER